MEGNESTADALAVPTVKYRSATKICISCPLPKQDGGSEMGRSSDQSRVE